jgi:hypothetical protein
MDGASHQASRLVGLSVIVFMIFRSQLEILVICEYHLQELHLRTSDQARAQSGIIFILGVYMSDGCQ